jgi:AcrR family transcriptional regulator
MIARDVGLTDPAVHYHFPTKRGLYESLLVAPDYEQLSLDTPPLTHEAIVQRVLHLFRWWALRPDLGRLLLRELMGNEPASIALTEINDLGWRRLVAAPLTDLLGREAEDRAAMLLGLLSGVYWDAILSFGDQILEVVEQEYFRLRIRAMVELALGPPAAAS